MAAAGGRFRPGVPAVRVRRRTRRSRKWPTATVVPRPSGEPDPAGEQRDGHRGERRPGRGTTRRPTMPASTPISGGPSRNAGHWPRDTVATPCAAEMPGWLPARLISVGTMHALPIPSRAKPTNAAQSVPVVSASTIPDGGGQRGHPDEPGRPEPVDEPVADEAGGGHRDEKQVNTTAPSPSAGGQRDRAVLRAPLHGGPSLIDESSAIAASSRQLRADGAQPAASGCRDGAGGGLRRRRPAASAASCGRPAATGWSPRPLRRAAR